MQYAYLSAITTTREHTMNVMKKILNALTFANVNNLGEFRALLRQIETSSASNQDLTQHGSVSSLSGTSSVPPGIGHAHGAL